VKQKSRYRNLQAVYRNCRADGTIGEKDSGRKEAK